MLRLPEILLDMIEESAPHVYSKAGLGYSDERRADISLSGA